MRRLLFIAPVLMLAACGGADEEETSPAPTAESLDLRISFPAPSEGGQQFITPEMTIPPRSERQWCFFTRYDGPDTGLAVANAYQPQYGHHVILLATNADEDEFPNGAAFDCTDRNTLPMTDMEPIYIPALPLDETDPAQSTMSLPAGMAVKLKQGTRLVIQSHYINPLDQPILVQDAVNFGYMNLEEVTTWASALSHTSTNIPIPPNQATSIQIECGFTQEVSFLYLLGHMHEWGTEFTLDYGTEGSTELERIYEVTPWRPEYRDVPPTDRFGLGEFTVYPGDRFVTTCSWYNDTDHEMNFPEEMCVTTGMVYPALVPLVCNAE